MKYIATLLVLALGASAVSAASLFLGSQAAQAGSATTGVSIPCLAVAVIGMMLTIALRCHAADERT